MNGHQLQRPEAVMQGMQLGGGGGREGGREGGSGGGIEGELERGIEGRERDSQ